MRQDTDNGFVVPLALPIAGERAFQMLLKIAGKPRRPVSALIRLFLTDHIPDEQIQVAALDFLGCLAGGDGVPEIPLGPPLERVGGTVGQTDQAHLIISCGDLGHVFRHNVGVIESIENTLPHKRVVSWAKVQEILFRTQPCPHRWLAGSDGAQRILQKPMIRGFNLQKISSLSVLYGCQIR